MHKLTFHIRKNDHGQFHWTLKAGNNNTIAWSAETYSEKSDCEHTMDLIINDMKEATVIDETEGEPKRLGLAHQVFPRRYSP
jgi:uncharacterized protein YegP (UPF0339 family)